MTAATLSTTPAYRTGARPGSTLSFGGVLRSEWIKLVSLRSTVWSLLLIPVITVGIGFLFVTTGSGFDTMPEEARSALAVQVATAGVLMGQLVVAVLGAITIGGEYSTGMIRSTMTAVPSRLPALWAKSIVLFALTFVVGLVSTFGTFILTSGARESIGLRAGLGDEGIALALVGQSLYLALVAVFALGIGAIIRNSAGAIGASLGVLLVLPIVFSLFNAEWVTELWPYLFSNAGNALFPVGGGAELETWQALLTLGAWIVASLGLGAVLLKRRDV